MKITSKYQNAKIAFQGFIQQPLFTNRTSHFVLLFILIGIAGCKKFVTVPLSPTSITNANVYNNDLTAISAQNGIYDRIMTSNSITNGGIIDMSFYPSLSADELTLGSNNTAYSTYYYTNSLTNQNTGGSDFWNNIYPLIYGENIGIEGLNASTNLTPAIKQQLLGEAKFMRALFYFYLTNLYGDVPLVLSSNFTDNISVSRTPQAQVYQQIILDLTGAQQLLSPTYLDGTLLKTTTSRLRPTKWAAAALLSRTYLYTKQWSQAVAEADTVINNTSLFNLAPLNNVFLSSGNNEAIWQLQPVQTGRNSPDAQTFIIPSTGLSSQWPVYLSNNLFNSFEPNDQRKVNWVGSVTVSGNTYYYPYKYKVNTYNAPVTEYEMVLRLGEQYLIRAEAEAQLGQTTSAAADLNVIRTRAGLPNTTATTQSDLLTTILHERQVELFTEWGHRWLDLKRTATINSVMGPPGNEYQSKVPGGTWNPNWQWYPISLSQLQLDPKLTQNPGY